MMWDGCIQPEVLDLIRQRYRIRHVVDLMEVDLAPHDLSRAMNDLADEQYAEDERAVILFHETDYCDHTSITGNTVYNFFRSCAAWNTPLEKLIFLTNHHGITDHLQHLARTICNSDHCLTVIETTLWYDFPAGSQLDQAMLPESWQPGPLYVCLNHRRRQHRLFTLCCLAEHDLLHRGAVSWHWA
jgi:hypothetical protein